MAAAVPPPFRPVRSVLLACVLVFAWAGAPARAATTVDDALGALTVASDDSSGQSIVMASTPTGVHVPGAGAAANGCTADGAGGLDCPGVARVAVTTGSGSDTIDLRDLTVPSTVDPGSG